MARTPQVLSQQQIAEINSRAKQAAFAPLLTAALVVIAIIVWGRFGFLAGVVLLIVGQICISPVRTRDRPRRTTSLTYPSTDGSFAAIQGACEKLAGANRVWYVATEQHTVDWKRQAGANFLVERKQAQVKVIEPPFISTNVTIWGVEAGNTKILFFPDTALIFQQGQYQAAPYESVNISFSLSRFADLSPPQDAEIIGHTWQYVNKNGGPDRRFSNNRQIPLALYGIVRITSSSGVDLRLYVSSRALAANFATILSDLLHPKRTSRGSTAGSQRRSSGRRSQGRQRSSGSRERRPPPPQQSTRRSAREILGVPPNASKNEIVAAYRKMAQMYHPDKVAGLGPEFKELAERRMKETTPLTQNSCLK